MWRPEFEFPGEQLAQYRILESAPGPQNQWRVMGDRTATMGQSLAAKGREAAKVDPDVLATWIEGIELSVLEDPSVRNWAVWQQWGRFTGPTLVRTLRT